MKNQILTLIAILVVAGLFFTFFDSSNPNGDYEMTTVEMVENGDVVLLDVRTAKERADGYAKDSLHFDYYVMEETGELPEIDKDAKVFVYCKSGGRAGKAEALMEANGFSDITNIGGFVDWQVMGGQVEIPNQEEFEIENLEEADLESLKKQMPGPCQVRYNSCRAKCATLDEGPDNWGECDANCELAYEICIS